MSRKQRIKHTLKQADSPLSTNQIADRVGLNWHTVDDELQEMHEQGAVDRRKLSNRLTLWWDGESPL